MSAESFRRAIDEACKGRSRREAKRFRRAIRDNQLFHRPGPIVRRKANDEDFVDVEIVDGELI